MKRELICACILFAFAGCRNDHPSPEAIREHTAQATAEAARDTKAVVDGVTDGLKSNKGSVDINHAPAERLETLPGIDAPRAQRIIAHRPYSDTGELVGRHVLSQEQYDRISGQIATH